MVFADPENIEGKELLAAVYQRLGYGAENGTWRNFYLMGAFELREGIAATAASTTASPEMVGALSIDQLFDSIAIRIDGPRAWGEHISIDWSFSDLGQTYRTTLENGVLVTDAHPGFATVDLSLSLTKTQFLGLLAGSGLTGISTTGDTAVLPRLLSVLDQPDPSFAIVTP